MELLLVGDFAIPLVFALALAYRNRKRFTNRLRKAKKKKLTPHDHAARAISEMTTWKSDRRIEEKLHWEQQFQALITPKKYDQLDLHSKWRIEVALLSKDTKKKLSVEPSKVIRGLALSSGKQMAILGQEVTKAYLMNDGSRCYWMETGEVVMVAAVKVV